jgi:hypothetical protein
MNNDGFVFLPPMLQHWGQSHAILPVRSMERGLSDESAQACHAA